MADNPGTRDLAAHGSGGLQVSQHYEASFASHLPTLKNSIIPTLFSNSWLHVIQMNFISRLVTLKEYSGDLVLHFHNVTIDKRSK